MGGVATVLRPIGIGESGLGLDRLAALERLLVRVACRAASGNAPLTDDELALLCMPSSHLDVEQSVLGQLERHIDVIAQEARTAEGCGVVNNVGVPTSWIADLNTLAELRDPPAVLVLIKARCAARLSAINPLPGTASPELGAAAKESLGTGNDENGVGESGWRTDPTGRHEGRYFVGDDATDLVRDDGVELIDPPGRDDLEKLVATPSPNTDCASVVGAHAKDDQRPAGYTLATSSDEELEAELGAWERYTKDLLPDGGEAWLAAQLDQPERLRTWRFLSRRRTVRP